jgi:serine phosphatase RsbU (regulator of sigma subunit)
MTNPSSSGRQRPAPQTQRKTQAPAQQAPRPAAAKPNPATSSGRSATAGNTATSSGRSPAADASSAKTKTSDLTGKVGPPGARSPGRQNSSDRQPGKPARPMVRGNRPRMTLRSKFMLVMAGVTVLTMVMLGLTMGGTANKYLYSQKTMDGIETAQLAVQIAGMVKDRVDVIKAQAKLANDNAALQNLQKEVEDYVNRYLTQVTAWGDGLSDIQGIRYHIEKIPEMSGIGVGDDEGTTIRSKVSDLFVPKRSITVGVPEGISIYEGTKSTKSGPVSILRFKVALPSEPPPVGFGRVVGSDGQAESANVRVDIAMNSVDQVRSNLMTTIAIAILIAIAAVLGIAQWLASSITKPLEVLLKDMQIVSKGKLGHRTTAQSTDEVGLLANEFNKMTESLEEAQSAVIEQEKQAYELSLAREVQQQLLPAQPPLITGFQCHSFYQGAKAVSGDYFDFIPLGPGVWGFIIADVSGKGIPGSMVMAVTRTVVRLVAPQRGHRADETLKDTNRLIAKQIKRGMFVTAFYAVLDENTGLLTYASAGHNPIVIYRAKTRSYELATTKGIALGFNEGPIFDRTIQVAQTTLERGDTMVMYTDGFPEAMNARNEEFGDEKFYEMIAANGHLDPPALTDAVVAGIAKHRGDAEQSDDLTILTVRRA